MQKLILTTSSGDFNREVNSYFTKGWQVIPGTLVITNAAMSANSTYIASSYAIVLEKDDAEFPVVTS